MKKYAVALFFSEHFIQEVLISESYCGAVRDAILRHKDKFQKPQHNLSDLLLCLRGLSAQNLMTFLEAKGIKCAIQQLEDLRVVRAKKLLSKKITKLDTKAYSFKEAWSEPKWTSSEVKKLLTEIFHILNYDD